MPFVESDYTIDVTGIEALDDETAQVVRLGGVFALGVLIHETSVSPTSDNRIRLTPSSRVGRLPPSREDIPWSRTPPPPMPDGGGTPACATRRAGRATLPCQHGIP